MRTTSMLIIIVVSVIVAAGYVFRSELFAPKHTWRIADSDEIVQGARTNSLSALEVAGSENEKIEVGDGSDIQSEAVQYVKELAEPKREPVSADSAEDFVRPDQVIALASPVTPEEMTTSEILSDPAIDPDKPLTVVREVEQVEYATPAQIIEEAAGDLDSKIKIVEEDEVRETTVRAIQDRFGADSDTRISVVRKIEHYEVITPRDLKQGAFVGSDASLKVIKEQYGLESTSVKELLTGEEDIPPDAVFYVRTVKSTDTQGIWGIVHDGLMDNFARGIALKRGESVERYQVHIPRYADEVLPDKSSSFLGKMIDDKTKRSYVYNYKLRRIGKNPDLVKPGQEIVIIQYSPEELTRIYKRFVAEQSG